MRKNSEDILKIVPVAVLIFRNFGLSDFKSLAIAARPTIPVFLSIQKAFIKI